MPLLEVAETKHPCAPFALRISTAMQVDQYALIIKASANDVVERRSYMSSQKIASFQAFLRTPEAQPITSTSRVRRSATNDASERPVQKPISAASSPAQTPANVAGPKV